MNAAAARSYLFVPGDNEALIGKALRSEADAVVMDLEDAVAPQRKGVARETVARSLSAQPGALLRRVVRIGAVRGGPGLEDLGAIVRPGLDAVRLPKVDDPGDVRLVASVLDELEREALLKPGSVRLQCTIESAVGVLRAEAIARAHPRVEALVFGHADFAADIGARPSPSGNETLAARSWLVLCSRAAGISAPIDGAFTALDDPEGLKRSVEQARNLGFQAKSAIHPKQLPTIHAGFSPTEDEIALAREHLAVFESAVERGAGAAKTASGQMVDEAVAKHARAVLARAGLTLHGRKEEE
ncbi:MAG: CoA ester lyase [Trueperaceae bacterium]